MMNVMIYVVFPVIGSVFIICVLFACMREIGTNIEMVRWKRKLILLSYLIGSVGLSLLGNQWLNLLMILLVPVIGHFVYNDTRYYLVCYFVFVITLYLVDIFSSVTMVSLYARGVLRFYDNTSYYIMLILTIRLCEFLVMRLLAAVIRTKNKAPISRGQLVATFLLPLFSVLNVFSMLLFLELYQTPERLLLFGLNVGLLVVVNIYFTSIFDTMGKNSKLKQEMELYRQKSRLETDYYRNLEQKYADTRNLVHDIRNHVQAMEVLYQEQNLQRGVNYTKDIHKMLNRLGRTFYTDHKMLNIILEDKVQKMKADGIEADIKIGELPPDFMRDVDVTTLFGNLLDNAIEAAVLWAAAGKGREGRIRLRMAAIHSFYSVTMENTSLQPVKKGNRFLSQNQKEHEGIGLINIERVVRQYGGDIQYEWDNDIFTTRIMLGSQCIDVDT